jgi:hypothetical protein
MGDMENAEAKACRDEVTLLGREDDVAFFKAEGIKCLHCKAVDHTLIEAPNGVDFICAACDTRIDLPGGCALEEAVELALEATEPGDTQGAIDTMARYVRAWKALSSERS